MKGLGFRRTHKYEYQDFFRFVHFVFLVDNVCAFMPTFVKLMLD